MLYTADMLQRSTCGAALLCGTPLGRHKRTEQRRIDSCLVLINIQQPGLLRPSTYISWSSLVSSTERHLSVRKCGTNPRSRTVAHSTFTTLLLYQSLPSLYQPFTMIFFNVGHPDVYIYTVIPRLTKIIRSAITFVSRNLR